MSICLGAWIAVPDGDARARAIYLRHYSARHYRDGRRRNLFVGPGGKMVLLTPECDALFVWRKFINDTGEQGVNCAVFRNEGPRLSSGLIREACELAWMRWPGERLYTYVAPRKIRSTNPGYCFLMAGWTVCGRTKGGLVILEKTALLAPAPHECDKGPVQLWSSDAPHKGVSRMAGPPISSVDEWDNEHPMSRAEYEAQCEAEYVRAMERAQYEAYCDDMRRIQAADEAYAEEAARAQAEAEAAEWYALGGE